jgi:GH24 family phage-related lysozyme (muramidase)
LFKFWRDLPHQRAAISELEAELRTDGYAATMRRDRPWFATWSTAGKQSDTSAALAIIREFEGCRLNAYLCPAGVWTIGVGATRYPDGRAVAQGDTITAIEADLMLRQEIDRISSKLCSIVPYWSSMSDGQRCALISFAFNLGDNFYNAEGFETISKRLSDKDWAKVPDALLLYRNPGSDFEAGLRRRREAEGKLWLEGLGLPKLRSGTEVQSPKSDAAKPQAAPPPMQQNGILLRVAYEAQNDNSGTGYRECFSSSAAMVARFYGKVRGDNEYIKLRSKYGDTTDAQAQIKTLQSLGLNARLLTNCSADFIESELRAGRPLMVGWLHKGPVTAPTGGGHWSVIIGFTDSAFIFNDPNGEADIINGGYINNTKGAGIAYSRKNWLRRWEVDGPKTGWALSCSA